MSKQAIWAEEIKATPERLWPLLTDPVRMVEWLYKEGQFLSPVSVAWADDRRGVGGTWLATYADKQVAEYAIREWSELQRLVYALYAVKNRVMKIELLQHQIDLDLSPGGTTVTWVVEWQFKEENTWLARLALNRTLNADVFEDMLAGSLRNLKALIETNLE